MSYYSEIKSKSPVFTSVVLLFITFLFIIGSVQGIADKVMVTDKLDDSGNLIETINIYFVNNTNSLFKLNLPDKASMVSVNGKKMSNNSLEVKLNCTECKINISFELASVSNKLSSSSYEIVRTMNIPITTNEFVYDVHLPIGMVISLNDSNNIIPTDATIKTDGNTIIISWNQKQPVFPQLFKVIYSNHESQETTASEFFNELNESSVLIVLLIVLVLGLVAGFFIGKKVKTQKSHQMTIVPLSLLNPDEQKILEVIKNADNKIRQKEIVKTLGWSKSKVSSIITNLEYKKIIRREKIGRNYDVFLIKDFAE